MGCELCYVGSRQPEGGAGEVNVTGCDRIALAGPAYIVFCDSAYCLARVGLVSYNKRRGMPLPRACLQMAAALKQQQSDKSEQGAAKDDSKTAADLMKVGAGLELYNCAWNPDCE